MALLVNQVIYDARDEYKISKEHAHIHTYIHVSAGTSLTFPWLLLCFGELSAIQILNGIFAQHHLARLEYSPESHARHRCLDDNMYIYVYYRWNFRYVVLCFSSTESNASTT